VTFTYKGTPICICSWSCSPLSANPKTISSDHSGIAGKERTLTCTPYIIWKMKYVI